MGWADLTPFAPPLFNTEPSFMQEIHNCLFHLGRDPSEILSWPIRFRKQLMELHIAQRKFDEQEAKKTRTHSR